MQAPGGGTTGTWWGRVVGTMDDFSTFFRLLIYTERAYAVQANLVGAYKALHAQQASLGFQLKDVKSSVFMTPLTDEALKNPLQQLFTNALKVAGWQSLSDSVLLRCCILEAPMGKVLETCCIEALDTLVESPDRILLLLRLSKLAKYPVNFWDRAKQIRARNTKSYWC